MAEYDRLSPDYVPVEELKAENDPRYHAVIGGEWLSVDVQEGSSCGLRPDGTIDCWQGYRDHQLPTEPFVEFTERLEFGCGLRADRSVSCWGELYR